MDVGPAEKAPAGLRSIVTPQDVREAALTLFAQRGYHGTALSQVAARVGIRTPSLYYHIDSKQDLLRDVMVETTDQVLAEFEAAIRDVDDAVERLRRAVRVYALRHARNRREAVIVNREVASLEEPTHSGVLAKRKQHERRIRRLIEEGQEAGLFDVPEPALASFAILEMCVSIALWFREDGALSAETVAQRYSEFALRLVGAPRAQ